MRGGWRGGWAAGIFAVGLAVRAVWWPRIFTPQGMISPHGADAYYHLRRIWFSVVRYPEILARDSYAAFPVGGEIVWPPGFDFAIASLARALTGDSQAGMETLAAWVPAVLGALTAVATAALAARVFSPAVGIVSGLLLALLPVSFNYTQLGKLDHHAAVELLSVLLVMGCVGALERERGRSPGTGAPAGPGSEPLRWPAHAALLGGGIACLLCVWAGGLLLIALLQGLAALWMFQAPSARAAVSRAWHLALVQALAAVLLAPLGLGRSWDQYGAWSPLVLCSFQPAWFAATAGACALFAVAWRRPALGGSAWRRWACAGVLGALALSAAVAAVPQLAGSLDYAAGWFGKDEDFQLGVAELRPLFAGRPEQGLTWLLYAFPLVLGWAAAAAWRLGRADRWLLIAWAAGFAAAALAQSRFVNAFAAPYAILTGAALVAIWGERRRLPAGLARGAASIALALMLVAAAWPSGRFFAGRAAVWWDPSKAVTPFPYIRALAYRYASRWLARHSPPTRGWLDPAQQPEYGVVVPWDVGHLVRYEARRPQLQDNFGVYVGREQFLAARSYATSATEGEALEILDRLGIRYVMVDGLGFGYAPAFEEPMARRLYRPAAPLEQAAAGRLALRRHRLRFETSPNQAGVWHLMVYEVVPGAQIVGRAAPGAEVAVTLPVISEQRRRPLVWHVRIRADAEGAFRLRVPYATGTQGAIRTGAGYRLRCGGQTGIVTVSEAEILSGAVVKGATLACGRGDAAG